MMEMKRTRPGRRACAVVVILRRSLSSSSPRSSIFSVSAWFSILSCSKSMRWRPSASSSFCRTVASSRAILRAAPFRAPRLVHTPHVGTHAAAVCTTIGGRDGGVVRSESQHQEHLLGGVARGVRTWH